MAVREFPVSWVATYRASSNRYVSTNGQTLYVGGTNDDNTYIGIPSAVKDSLKSSKTTPKLKFKMRVNDAGEFDFGGHRETYNKASGSLPWYRYLGLHPIYSSGWQTTDLTSAFKNDYLNGNYHGIVLYGESKAEAYGKTGDSNQAVFVVEGTWNTAPEMPPVTYSPSSSTVAQDYVLMSWGASSDAETSSGNLTYQLQYYDGSDYIETWTVSGATEYNYPVHDKPETTRASWRVRAYDGELYSPWKYGASFTVSHNVPPLKSTQLEPSGGKVVDRTKTIRATWKYNDQGPQAGYQIAWAEIREDGSRGPWTYVPSGSFFNTTSQYHDFAPNTFPNSEITWTVKTKDQQGEVSPFATYQRFFAGEASDAPIWISPQSGDTINSSEIVAQWSSLDQVEYQIQLFDPDSLLWEEQEIASSKSTSVGYALENNVTYTLRVRVLNESSGLWSSWASIYITTQFIPPLKPILTVETEDGNGEGLDNIILSWDTDNGTVDTPTSYVEVFRRVFNSTVPEDFEKISYEKAPDSSMVDYSPASETTYEYKVRAWGDNGTFTDSDIVEAQIVLDRSFLQRVESPSDLIVIDAEERSQSFDLGGELMFFANREKPVFEHSITEYNEVPIVFTIYSVPEMRNAVEFLKRKETFLYRDNSGRRFFCVVTSPSLKDKKINGFEFTLTLKEVDFEGII